MIVGSILYFIVKLGFLQLYPIYVTYKAIKLNDQKQHQSLLIFWVVSLTYFSIEHLVDNLVFWLPFYTELKLIVVLWLILPQTQGTFIFYTLYFDPFLQRNEIEIDNAIVKIQTKLKNSILMHRQQWIQWINKLIFRDNKKKETTKSSDVTMNEVQDNYLPYSIFNALMKPIDRSDSHESLQSYVDISPPSSNVWSDSLSHWTKKQSPKEKVN